MLVKINGQEIETEEVEITFPKLERKVKIRQDTVTVIKFVEIIGYDDNVSICNTEAVFD